MRTTFHLLTAFCLCLLLFGKVYAEPEKALTKQQLYQLLLAEFANARGRQTQALPIFLQQAHELQSPKLAKQATYLAYDQKQHKAMLEAATLWKKLEPNSKQAPLLQSLAFKMNKQDMRALESMTQYYKTHQKSYFVELLSGVDTKTPSFNMYQQQLKQLSFDKTATSDILLANALLAQKSSQTDTANDFAWQAIKKAPENNATVNASLRLLQANNSNKATKAFTWLLKKQPSNTELRQQFGLYLAKNNIKAATEQFEKLIQQEPGNYSYRYQLALVQLEAQEFEPAKNNLEQLTNNSTYQNSAHYYLGVIASLQEQYQQAETHFAMVNQKPLFADAQLGIARIHLAQKQWQKLNSHINKVKQQELGRNHKIDWILIETQALLEQQQHPQAITTISHGIDQFSDALPLYYQRAMIYAQTQAFDAMEQDLRHILSIQPEHFSALNALGFTLADNNTRLDEAYQLIQKAYQISPEEPAILDSLGWVYYRQGELKKALTFLQKAMQKLPDPEIAAHLGEVLWQMNKSHQANDIWKDSLKDNPNHKVLNDTIRRLNAQLLQSCQPNTTKHSC